jgi:signal recognition particle GTPase
VFESLSDRLSSVVSKLCNRGLFSEADVDELLTGLLEVDANVGRCAAC